MSYGSPTSSPTDQYTAYSLVFTVDGGQVSLVFSAGTPGTDDARIQRVIDVLNADPNITFDFGHASYGASVSREITAT